MAEKQKNDDKQYNVEWSFSFERLGEQISEFVKGLGVKGEEDVKISHFSEPIGTATSARVRLDLAAGETTVNTFDPTSDMLLEAEITHIGEIKFASSGETEKIISLSQSADAGEWFRHVFAFIGTGQRLRWDVGLTPNIPVDLAINGGVGRSVFNLSALKTQAITINGGAGEVILTLPAVEGYRAAVNGGVGKSDVTIPAGASVELALRLGTGEINLEIGEGAAVTATINGGVGALNLTLPAGAAARIEGKAGIGDISVPAHFARVSGGGDFLGKSGVWQTANYETAERRISIRYEGGIGALNVR